MKIDLSKYRINHNSQFGEDGVIEKLFELAGINTGWLIEFGAWDGIHYSNTRYPRTKNPSFGLMLIEENKERFREMQKLVGYSENTLLLNLKVNWESEDNSLNKIFTQYNVNDIALLSIDVDGDDLLIWQSLDIKKFHPKIVIIESGHWKNDDDMMRIDNEFKSKGYTLVCVTGNFIFIRNDLGIKTTCDIFQLLRSSGSPEYNLFCNAISIQDYEEQIKAQQAGTLDHIKLAQPQLIYLENEI